MRCPYCQSKLTGIIRQVNEHPLTVFFFECRNCKEPFAYYRKLRERGTVPKVDDADIPQLVRKLSPAAFEMYSDSLFARANQLNRFAAVGLRMALEHLLYDYLEKFKKVSSDELQKMRLPDMIHKLEQLEPETYKTVCTAIIKEFGNENAHAVKKFPPIDLQKAFHAYEMLCKMMGNYMSLIETDKELRLFYSSKKKR